MDRINVLAIVCLLVLPLGAQAFDANGVEDRCGQLGNNCFCSEPLNAGDPDSALLTGYNPSDTLPASPYECTDQGGFWELADTVQTQLNTVSVSNFDGGALSDALPQGHELTYTMRDAVGESSGDGVLWATIAGHRAPPNAARVCARFYYTVTQDFGGVQSAGARNKMLELSNDQTYMQVQENNCQSYSGPTGGVGNPYCPIVLTVGAQANWDFTDSGGTHTFDECMYAGGRGVCTQDSNFKCFNNNECSSRGKGSCINRPPPSWCMLETCAVCPGGNMTSGGNCHYEGWHRILSQDREAFVTTTPMFMSGFGNLGSRFNWFGGDWNHSSGVGEVFRSMWMVADWNSENGQRIGAAMEIEGGTGPPPAAPPAPPLLLD